MPVYIFQKDKKIVEIILGMNDPKVYFGEDGKEEGWERVWTNPNASIDSQWDADSSADFINKSNNKKGSYGDLLDKSKELSEKREKKYGIDPQKEKYLNDWSKQRKGKKHPEKLKKEAREIARKNGLTITD